MTVLGICGGGEKEVTVGVVTVSSPRYKMSVDKVNDSVIHSLENRIDYLIRCYHPVIIDEHFHNPMICNFFALTLDDTLKDN